MSLPPMEPEASEEVYPGIVRQYFSKKQITIFTLTSMSQGIANVWGDLALEAMRNHDDSQPYLVLHDISVPGVGVNYLVLAQYDFLNIGVMPHNRPAVEEFMNTHARFAASVGVLVSAASSGQFLQLLANRATHAYEERISYKTFTDTWAALEWLKQQRA